MSMPIRSRRDTESVFVKFTTPQEVGPGAYNAVIPTSKEAFRDTSKIFISGEKRTFQRQDSTGEVGPGSYETAGSSIKRDVSNRADYDLNIPRFATPASYANDNPGPGQYEPRQGLISPRKPNVGCGSAWAIKDASLSSALLRSRTSPSIPLVQVSSAKRPSNSAGSRFRKPSKRGVDFARGSKRPNMFKAGTTPSPCSYQSDKCAQGHSFSKKGTSAFASTTPKQGQETKKTAHIQHIQAAAAKRFICNDNGLRSRSHRGRLLSAHTRKAKVGRERPKTSGTPGPGAYGMNNRDWLSLYHIKEVRKLESAKSKAAPFASSESKQWRYITASKNSPGPAEYFKTLGADIKPGKNKKNAAVFGTTALKKSIFDVNAEAPKRSTSRFGPVSKRKHPVFVRNNPPSSMFASKTKRFPQDGNLQPPKDKVEGPEVDEEVNTTEIEPRPRSPRTSLCTSKRFDHGSPFYQTHAAYIPGPGDYRPEITRRIVRENMAQPEARFGNGNRFGGPDDMYSTATYTDITAAPGSYNISRSLLKRSKNVTMKCQEE